MGGAIAVAIGATLVGYFVDSSRGTDLTFVFAALYFLGCVAAVAAVRHRGLFTACVQPPLILFAAVPLAYQHFRDTGDTSVKDILLNVAIPLVERFPLMLFTTVVVLAVAAGRVYLARSSGDARAGRATRPARRARLLDADGPAGPPPRPVARRTADGAARPAASARRVAAEATRRPDPADTADAAARATPEPRRRTAAEPARRAQPTSRGAEIVDRTGAPTGRSGRRTERNAEPSDGADLVDRSGRPTGRAGRRDPESTSRLDRTRDIVDRTGAPTERSGRRTARNSEPSERSSDLVDRTGSSSRAQRSERTAGPSSRASGAAARGADASGREVRPSGREPERGRADSPRSAQEPTSGAPDPRVAPARAQPATGGLGMPGRRAMRSRSEQLAPQPDNPPPDLPAHPLPNVRYRRRAED